MKKLWISISIVIFLVGCKNRNISINDKIVDEIDRKLNEEIICTISMQDITNFGWDKMAIFEVGSSNDEISKKLGVEYNDSTDLISGIIFVYNGKIVYKYSNPYNPEKPSKLEYVLENGQENCMTFSPGNAIFKGIREKIDNEVFYKIIPMTNLEEKQFVP